MSAAIEIDLRPYQDAARKREPIARRTYAKLHRRSIPAGAERRVIWNQQGAGRAKRALRAHAKSKWERGRRMGGADSVSRIAVDLYCVLIDKAVAWRGNLYPTEQQLADWVGCGLSSINAAKAWLSSEGWLDWDRRFEFTPERGVRGQQVEQTSNFYRVLLPNVARQLLAAWDARRVPRETEDQAYARQKRQALADEGRRIDALQAQEDGSPAIRAAAEKFRSEAGEGGSSKSSGQLC
jgi:hypothetical protein